MFELTFRKLKVIKHSALCLLIHISLWQWQAGSRKQKAASLQDQGLTGDENQWGQNWLDRWMAARPWENRLLDSNAKESVTVGDDKVAEEDKTKAPTPNKPKGKILVSTTQSNGQQHKKGTGHKKSHSDVSGSSSGQSASVQPTASLDSPKVKEKPSDETTDEVSSQPSKLASRSTSNPKERPAQINTPAKKRLSLPNNGKSSVSCVIAITSPEHFRKLCIAELTKCYVLQYCI